jgi:hypothetical protein
VLTKPTVFVLGAGASVPFGFPVGRALSELVVRDLRDGRHGFKELRELGGFSEVDITTFRNAFFRSGKLSVDAFLEHRDDLMDIGKAATALALIRFENEGKLFSYDDSNWLRETFARLTTSFDEFPNNRLSFVTFNYDRTVEHFLFSALQNSYRKSDDESRAVLEQIPVVHLHGRLGFLPWQKGSATREFSTKLTPEGQIVVMGFGYNRLNISRLGLDTIPQGRAIGTCQGLGGKGEMMAQQMCNERIRFVSGDCVHFIREVVSWS